MEQQQEHTWEEEALLVLDALNGNSSLAALVGMSADELAKFMSVGISHLQVGRVDDAIDVFRGLTALEPKNFVFQQYLGLALEEHKDFAGADEAYSKMLACIGDRDDLDVERTEGYLLRGRVRALLGALPAAAEDLREAQGLKHSDDQLTMMIEEFARVMGGAK